jgi:hypothetical protein
MTFTVTPGFRRLHPDVSLAALAALVAADAPPAGSGISLERWRTAINSRSRAWLLADADALPSAIPVTPTAPAPVAPPAPSTPPADASTDAEATEREADTLSRIGRDAYARRRNDIDHERGRHHE